MKSDVNFLIDTLIVQTLAEDSFHKTAEAEGMVSQLVDKVKTYFDNNIDPNDKSGSLLNKLAPGVIWGLFKSLGFGWLGALIGLAMNVFQVDIKSILSSIYEGIKPLIESGKQTTSSAIDSVVDSAFGKHVQNTTEEEAEKAIQFFETKSYLKDAQLVKLDMIAYQNNKFAGPSFLSLFSSRKFKVIEILKRVLGWVFKVAIASAGLMVAGDAVNKIMGRPNALDGTIQHGKPNAAPKIEPTAPIVTSKQTKFKLNPNYDKKTYNVGSNWVESVSNNEPSIIAMLLQFAKEVYQLNGEENAALSSPAFQILKNRIVSYNRNSAGDTMVFIPKYLTSKKQIADIFIDDIAASAK